MKFEFRNKLIIQIIITAIVAILLYFISVSLDVKLNQFINKYFGLFALISLGLALLFFYKARKEKDDPKMSDLYLHLAALLQTLFAIIAIWFAVSESKENNMKLNEQLENQRKQIVKQEELINRQDTAARLNLNELKAISGTSGNLQKNMESINEMVSEMPTKIDNISGSFDFLNTYTKEQYKILKDESLKKADIFVDHIEYKKLDENTFGSAEIILKNRGNIEGKVVKLFLYFDKDVIDTLVTFTSYAHCMIAYESDMEFSAIYDLSSFSIIVSAFDYMVITTCSEIRFSRVYLETMNISVRYMVIFSDKNEGRFNQGTLNIRLPNS